MSSAIQKQIEFLTMTNANELNMDFIVNTTRRYQDGEKLSPARQRIAETFIALKKAYAERNWWKASDGQTWDKSDEEMLAFAIAKFGDGNPKRHAGVRKDQLPRGKVEGDHVVIRYSFLGEDVILDGKIVKVIEYPMGVGFVIEINEILDYYVWGKPPLKYESLWVSHDPTGQSGFVHV